MCGGAADPFLRNGITHPDIATGEARKVHVGAVRSSDAEPDDLLSGGGTGSHPGGGECGNTAPRKHVRANTVPLRPLGISREHVAGDDQRVDPEPVRRGRQRACRTSLVARNRPLRTEGRQRRQFDVRAATTQLMLDDAPQGDLTEIARVEGAENADEGSGPSVTVHVRPRCGSGVRRGAHVSGVAQGVRAIVG